MKQQMICVLNDDETYTGLEGCWIAVVTPAINNSLEQDQDPDDAVDQTQRYSLAALVNWAACRGYFGEYPKMMPVETDTE